MEASNYGGSLTSRPHCKYLSSSSLTTPYLQVLGYTLGKTLGSGKFGKVKAAWSPFERRMVKKLSEFLFNWLCNADIDEFDYSIKKSVHVQTTIV